MEFKINEKDHQLSFGMKCINELDKRYSVDYQGLKFGMGVNMSYMALNMMNPTALLNIISAATAHEKNKPTDDQIEQAIVDYAEEHQGLETLFNDLKGELGKSPLMKDTIKKFENEAKVQNATE
ncbi:tail assembly chaperone [Paraliobacillus ryukyuensis]|uniref:tail assembly chaperone n=1 Tax=Paraliobacillus ryukyuensis TaxID=200904 RepID=UPI0009A76A12|nr:tail assembly chaperone [Paraliobacillus ryukyuensis]